MNLGLIAVAAGGLVALSMTVLWQMEKNTSIALEGKFQVLSTKFEQQKHENIKLKNALSESLSTSKKNKALVEKNSQRMVEYSNKLLMAEKENNLLAIQINDLRTAEMENAIKEPYQRGNVAAARWANIMQRIAGATSANSKGVNRTDTAATGFATDPHSAQAH